MAPGRHPDYQLRVFQGGVGAILAGLGAANAPPGAPARTAAEREDRSASAPGAEAWFGGCAALDQSFPSPG